MTYAFPPGGLPDQSQHPESTAVFTTSYAVIPASVQRDIVTSLLPGWSGMRMWVLARPLSGFAETFAQYAVELEPQGGSLHPETDVDAQGVIFVAHGTLRLRVGGEAHDLEPGGYAYLPPSSNWEVFNVTDQPCGFHWIRKKWDPADSARPPPALITHERDVSAVAMPDTNGVWATQRFVDPLDLRHDMHVNIVTFQPGGRIPFAETHVMEHGLYVLEGTARYLLNKDWVDVGPGDFMWLRAFCPQACVATGDGPFRYLLYKDVNRHMQL